MTPLCIITSLSSFCLRSPHKIKISITRLNSVQVIVHYAYNHFVRGNKCSRNYGFLDILLSLFSNLDLLHEQVQKQKKVRGGENAYARADSS